MFLINFCYWNRFVNCHIIQKIKI